MITRPPNSSRPGDVVFPFGRHKGRTLLEIAAQDLLYLDWVRDKIETEALSNAVGAFCDERSDEIERLIAEKEEREERRQFRKRGW